MLVVLSRFPKGKPPYKSARCLRYLSVDSRSRLSTFWAPTGGRSPQDGDQDDSHALLVRGGFLRQAHSGVFHLLPLGLRVQHKLETLIDKHMESIGASKISLSSISTEELWRQSGRYSANSELLRVNDRRESGFLLSPTHEEEITSLASGMIQSYKDLPLRLYQIGRKYRDEKRPRQGLLRAKEFLMKDLYTFDFSQENALATYELVRQAYNNLFDELNIPYLVANADSGNMGGKLSHEYHFASPKGEDNVWSCDSCSYAANEEVVEQRCDDPSPVPEAIFEGISTDRKTKIIIHIPAPEPHTPSTTPLPWSRIHKHVNLHAIKRLSIPIDTGIEPSTLHSLLAETTSQLHVHDLRTPASSPSSLSADLTALHPGSPCPSCASGHLHARKAIEVAHTFHLGTRYSAPLSALVSLPNSTAGKVPMHMGCHGIGVSRMMGAMAALLADGTGLNWPRVVAPFECLVASTGAVVAGESEGVYDGLRGAGVDVVLDDRDKGVGWKLRDADLIGYPVLVVLGKGWGEGRVEVQCRRLGVKEEVGVEGVRARVGELLARL